MDYSTLCKTYEALEATTKGLEKTTILSNFLAKIKETPTFIYLLQGRVFPDYDNRELGISHQLAMRAIAKATGMSDKEVLESFKKLGDLGLVASNSIKNKKQQQSLFSSKLSLQKVMSNLIKITVFEGKGTVEQKIGLIVELLNSATPLEAQFIIRTVLGDLKIGVGSGILRDAIVELVFDPREDLEEKKAARELVQEAYDKSTDFAEVFEKACNKKLDEIILSPGKPLKVMLFPKAANVDDAFRIVGKPAAFEYKYDGFRVMINKDEKGKIKVFTRRLEEVTKQFPEITEYVKKYVKGNTFILDAEAVGFDAKTKEYTDFQSISQRIRRKHGIEIMAKKFPIEIVIFDIIYHDDKNLIDQPFEKRRKLIENIVEEVPLKIILAKQILTDDDSEVEEFYKKALEENQEGLMAKNLEAPYKPGARIGHAVKLKPEDNELDLVITGAEWGTGKRAGWLTSFDISCKNNGDLLEIGKVSTGLKELKEQGLSFAEMTEKLQALTTRSEGRKIEVSPKIVVSVQYQNIQKSTNYSSGYALRFPRIKILRPDRGSESIASLEEIEKEVGEK
jgi:DNA ligase 1